MLQSPRMDDAAASIYANVNRCRPAQWIDDHTDDFHIKHALIQRNWFELRDKLLAKFPSLTAKDVDYEPGRKHEMMRAIEEKLEISPAKLQRIISEL